MDSLPFIGERFKSGTIDDDFFRQIMNQARVSSQQLKGDNFKSKLNTNLSNIAAQIVLTEIKPPSHKVSPRYVAENLIKMAFD